MPGLYVYDNFTLRRISPLATGPVEPPPPVDPEFAMLFSGEELLLAQDRAENGPFRTTGDFAANSPGHWTEMQAAMNFTFSSARWDGPTNVDSNGTLRHAGNGAGTSNDPPPNVRLMAHDMMSAAYAAAITDNPSVAAAIVAEMEWQATRPQLDFSNRTLYPFSYFGDLNPLFMMCVWIKDYVLAYDVCKALGHSSSVVEQWFLDLAELSEEALHVRLATRFPDRKFDSYINRQSNIDSEISGHARRADGAIVSMSNIALWYNNRRSQKAGLVGLVGALLNNNYYKAEFKRYCREWLMFGHSTEVGYWGDFDRGTDSFPQLGMNYGFHGMESLASAMEALARQGDKSLYDFSSNDGAKHATWGTAHQKSMQDVFEIYVKWVAQTFPATYTGSGSPPPNNVAGSATNRIQSTGYSGSTREIINDGWLLYPANYYNKPDWVDIVLRVGTPTGYTSVFQASGNISGARTDWRQRFLRSITTNPYPA